MIAGMDPAAIKDPVARAAYQKAIADNKANNEQNKLQAALKECAEELPRMESWLAELFAKAPAANTELEELLMLGGFNDEVRARILKAVGAPAAPIP